MLNHEVIDKIKEKLISSLQCIASSRASIHKPTIVNDISKKSHLRITFRKTSVENVFLEVGFSFSLGNSTKDDIWMSPVSNWIIKLSPKILRFKPLIDIMATYDSYETYWRVVIFVKVVTSNKYRTIIPKCPINSSVLTNQK